MLKKLNPHNMEVVYAHAFYRLVRVAENGKKDLEPIIFICGQMGHKTQFVESKTGLHKNSCYQYQNFFEYDDEVHTPYIFIYDYPIKINDKSLIADELFARSLENALDFLKLENVTVMGISNGGMIGTLLSKSPRVKEVLALHAPIFGVPLLQREKWDQVKKELHLPEKMIYLISKLMVNDEFGYMRLMKDGFSNLEDVADLDKITFTGSDLTDVNSKNKLANYLAYMNYLLLGIPRDGMVSYDEEKVKSTGINFIKEEGVSHFELGTPNYTTPYYQKLIRKR